MIKNNSGFSLMEILIAMTILSLLVAPFFSNIIHYNKIWINSAEHYRISMEAQNLMEHTKQLTYIELFQLAEGENIPWNGYYLDLEADCPFWNDDICLNMGIVFKKTECSNYCYIILPETVSGPYVISSPDGFEINLSLAEHVLELKLKDGKQFIAEKNINGGKPVNLHLFTYEKDDRLPVTVSLNNFNGTDLSIFTYEDLFNISSVAYHINYIPVVIQENMLTAQDIEIPYKAYRSEKPYISMVETKVDVYSESGDLLLRRHGFYNIPY